MPKLIHNLHSHPNTQITYGKWRVARIKGQSMQFPSFQLKQLADLRSSLNANDNFVGILLYIWLQLVNAAN